MDMNELVDELKRHMRINLESHREFYRYFNTLSELIQTSLRTNTPIPNELLIIETEETVKRLQNIVRVDKNKVSGDKNG